MTGRRFLRKTTAIGLMIAAVAALGLMASAVGTASAAPEAHASRTLNLTEHATLRLVKKRGNTLYERGTVRGTLSGPVTARFNVGIAKVTGTVTIYPRGGGSLTITVVGYPRSAGVNARFAGRAAVLRGTGRYARAVGTGTFSGVVNRRTWAASVTANARLRY